MAKPKEFLNAIIKDLIDSNDGPNSLFKYYIELAKEDYLKGSIDSAKFLIAHFSSKKNEDCDYDYAKTVLFDTYNNNKSNYYFSNLMGIFYLNGYGVNKDADKAIDYFLENESEHMNVESDIFLAKIYLDGANGYKSEEKAYKYINRAIDKLLYNMEKISLDTLTRITGQEEDEFLFQKMRMEKIIKFRKMYKEVLALENIDKEKAALIYEELFKINLATRYLVKARLYFEGNIYSQDLNKFDECFNKYYETFEDNIEIEKYKLDFPMYRVFKNLTESNVGKIEIYEDNYPVHKKSMVDRYINELKEASDYGIESAMVKYGECYMNLFQDFPVDFEKAYQIFTEVQYKLHFSKANLYLFFMNLYGLGTKKDTEEALKIATSVQSESNIGEFLKSIYYYEIRKYKTCSFYIPAFYKACCEIDLMEIKEMLDDPKLPEDEKKRLSKDRLYNYKKGTFGPLEVLTCLEQGKYEQAFEKAEEAYYTDYNQANLILAFFYYNGIHVKKSLPKFKEYINEFILNMIGFTKESLIKDGYIQK